MDEKLRQLLDQMPDRAPRSKLEPHREVIRELRKKRRTYSEIAAFFRQHLQLSVAPSTIHDFVKTRARQARHAQGEGRELSPSLPALSAVSAEPKPLAGSTLPPPPAGEGRERLRALRSQPASAATEPSRFQFDATEPLTLNPPPKEK